MLSGTTHKSTRGAVDEGCKAAIREHNGVVREQRTRVSTLTFCLTASFTRAFQLRWWRAIEPCRLYVPTLYWIYPHCVTIPQLMFWYSYHGDERINAAYREWLDNRRIVRGWLTLAVFLNWLILTAPRLPRPVIVYRGERNAPRAVSAAR